MKTRNKLFWWAAGCWITSISFGIPQLNTFAMIFLTGSMVIKGVKEV